MLWGPRKSPSGDDKDHKRAFQAQQILNKTFGDKKEATDWINVARIHKAFSFKTMFQRSSSQSETNWSKEIFLEFIYQPWFISNWWYHVIVQMSPKNSKEILSGSSSCRGSSYILGNFNHWQLLLWKTININICSNGKALFLSLF